jgi:hypothetical protein
MVLIPITGTTVFCLQEISPLALEQISKLLNILNKMKQFIKQPIFITAMLLLFFTGSSCKKFLDEKPNKKLVIPSTLTDLQALLDYTNVMIVNDPYADEFSSDNFYLYTSTWQAQPDYDRRMYTWEKDNIFEPSVNDWSNLYSKIYYANTVLENIEKIERNEGNSTEWDNIKGQALMVRAKGFMQAVNLWSPAYDPATANTDMGIPLRLSTDFSETSVRPSVQETYDQVIQDFKASIPLLPNRGIHQIRACKAAAYAFLARTYLSMRNYPKAGLYADSSLQVNSSLLNYNSLNPAASFPIPAFNTEINFYTGFYALPLNVSNAKVDTILYRSYAANDCRKTVFFSTNADGSIAFKGTYIAATGNFGGITSDEVYLMRAESFARAGNTVAALADLNTLLAKRYNATFVPITASDANDALNKILLERRKELLFRGLRWMDIKRLNKEGAGIIQKRIVNNQTYILSPNDLRYALPIPEYVINISGMPQNPR